MRVLVTGAAGYVGSILVPHLLGKDHEVIALDNMMYGTPTLVQHFMDDRFEFVKGDVRNAELVQNSVRNADAVVHLASLVGYPICDRYPAMAESVNVGGTKNVISSMKDEQILIHASTGSMYGSPGSECTEETPLKPLTLYGRTKADAEGIAREYNRSIVLRFATGYGLSPRIRLDLLVNNLVYEAIRNGVLLIYEKDFTRTFIHVRDMVRSIEFALSNSDAMIGEVFNVGSSECTLTKEELAKMIQKQTNCRLVFADVGQDRDKRDYSVSHDKIERLGYRANIRMERGVRELADGFSSFRIQTGYSNQMEY